MSDKHARKVKALEAENARVREQLKEKEQMLARGESTAIYALKCLTEEERYNVFQHFCTHCGRADPRCQCWNDE
jgi:hypothetical protein